MTDDQIKNWTDVQIENVINAIYSGEVSPSRLPVSLYNETVKRLTDAVFVGFAGSPDDFVAGSAELDLLKHFEHNVAIFSGAKTHQQIVDMTREVFKDGLKQPFSDFKKAANEIFDTYNRDWLLTEYKMASNQAIFGRKWIDIQANKDIFPKLKYVTSGDGRVRADHAKLDGIVRDVDDPFWRQYYPPNDWGCRCNVEQELESTESTSDDAISKISSEYVPSDLFNGNAGIDKVIFDPRHPYFTVNDRYKLLKEQNFNLPTPPKPKSEPRPKKVKAPKTEPIKTTIPSSAQPVIDSMKSLTGLDETIGLERIWKHVPTEVRFFDSVNYPVKKYKNKSFFTSHDKKIRIGIQDASRWRGAHKEMVVLHELGHSVHYELKQINSFFVSDRAEKWREDMAKSFKANFKRSTSKKQLDASTPIEQRESFWEYDGYNRENSFLKVAAKYLKEQGINDHDSSEMIWTLYDVVGGLTKGNFGGGHEKKYYRDNNGGIKEMFANMFQVVNSTDPRAKMVVEKFWPDALKISNEYFDELLK